MSPDCLEGLEKGQSSDQFDMEQRKDGVPGLAVDTSGTVFVEWADDDAEVRFCLTRP
jgi:hypothetical protein